MISFTRGSHVFNYRVAGVAAVDDHVLLHRAAGEDFWTFPGGRVELGESAAEALRREMREELDAQVEIVRPLWLVENFFHYAGSACHELAIYFLMELPAAFRPGQALSFQGVEPDLPEIKLVFQWFPRKAATLSALPLLPSFLPAALENLPDAIQHVVHIDTMQPETDTAPARGE